jgi:hypothetical protein
MTTLVRLSQQLDADPAHIAVLFRLGKNEPSRLPPPPQTPRRHRPWRCPDARTIWLTSRDVARPVVERAASLIEENGVLVASGETPVDDQQVFGLIDSGRK